MWVATVVSYDGGGAPPLPRYTPTLLSSTRSTPCSVMHWMDAVVIAECALLAHMMWF